MLKKNSFECCRRFKSWFILRNGTMMPWDDDLDILANSSAAQDILEAFSKEDVRTLRIFSS